MADTISRQAAIKTALEYLVEYCGAAFDPSLQLGMSQKLNELPPVQPERKKGRWLHGREIGIKTIDDCFLCLYEDWKCSDCGYVVAQKPLWIFCPQCGADMREGEQDG